MPVLARTTFVSDRCWTIDDIERMPRAYRCEVLDGVLYLSEPPPWPHGGIAENLGNILSPWVRSRRLGWVLSARNGIHLDDRNFVDPHLMYLRRDQVPRVGSRPTSAAVAVEVVSPSNVIAPREHRETLLRQIGVEELWYVDYATRSLEVRGLRTSGYETVATFRSADLVTSAQFPGLEFPLTALWEDLGDE
jgi:Uma2 family endonuclease